MPGTLTIGTISDGTNSTSATNAIQGSAKAWVNFAGASGTRNASHNVSSVTRTATGVYTVNFANALADANYTVTANANQGSSAGVSTWYQSQTTTSFQLQNYVGGAAYDAPSISVAVFR